MTAGDGVYGAGRQLVARLATNTMAHAAGTAAGAVIGFFTFVAVSRGLGPSAFGDLTAAMVFLWIPVVLADVGFSTAVVRAISADPARTEQIVRAFLPFRAAIGAGAVAVAVAVGSVALDDRAQTALVIGSLGALLQLVTLAYSPVLEARLQVAWAMAASVLGRVTTLGLTLAVLALDLGFASVVWAHVAGFAITCAAQLLVVRRHVRLRPSLDLAYGAALLRGSLTLGIALALAMIFFRVDTVLLAVLTSSHDVGLYAAAYRFLELAALVTGAIGVSVVPTLSHFVAHRDPRVRGLVQRAFELFVAAAVPIAVVMFAFADEIVELTAGPEYADGAVALRILAPYVILSFSGALFMRVLIATSRDRTLLAVAAAVLAVNVVANLILLPLYGYVAAAATSVASEALLFVLVAWAARAALGFFPALRPLGVVGLAAAAMALAILVLPGPATIVAPLAVLVYAVVLAAVPGTVRELVSQLRPSASAR